ncbi:hypothetical protein LTR10_024505 [Elasticomyces elasticus]|nr:hypothetical protein LTR10_024505 [Elasticomyces elasticus]
MAQQLEQKTQLPELLQQLENNISNIQPSASIRSPQASGDGKTRKKHENGASEPPRQEATPPTNRQSGKKGSKGAKGRN